jgi:hypothetical protein
MIVPSSGGPSATPSRMDTESAKAWRGLVTPGCENTRSSGAPTSGIPVVSARGSCGAEFASPQSGFKMTIKRIRVATDLSLDFDAALAYGLAPAKTAMASVRALR